eukprot:13596077-Heterocapsa_arctica.AAC.1
MGVEQKHVWGMCLKLNICLKLRCCANFLAFCEEYTGDSEDARRPLGSLSLQKPSNTFRAIYT